MDPTKKYNKVEYAYNHRVPKTRKANLEFRKKLYLKCASDSGYRAAIWEACKKDTLFFFNAFLWLYEPRPGMEYGSGKLPFLIWPHQERAMRMLDQNWGLNDIRFWKSRGEGATWLVTMRVLKDWIFDDSWNPGAFGLVSRNEDTVDSPDDPDSLMWKLDWQLRQLPSWMVPGKNAITRNRSHHSLKNHLNDATIIGYAASEDVGSGGRKRMFMMDELAKFGVMRKGADEAAMASTGPVTECRVIISTPKGTANKYYDVITEDVDIEKYVAKHQPFSEDDHQELLDKGVAVLHWSDNPYRRRGLFYCREDGSLEPVDLEKCGDIPREFKERWPTTRQQLERKGFQVTGTMRSPWYDRQCLRPSATPQSVAQEYDLDFGGSGFTIFKSELIAKAKRHVREPLYVMAVDYEPYSLDPRFIEHGTGLLKVWQPLIPDVKKPPLDGSYVVGADIASGLGGSMHSNSVASVLDLTTGEQVAEWANNATDPEEFCDICIAVAKFFNYAEIIHEANGPFGKAFVGQLLRRKYPRIYRSRTDYKTRKKTQNEYGWGSQQQTKPAMLRGLAYKIETGLVIPRSKALVEELKNWGFQGGRVVHAKAVNTEDESSKNEAHGDRVIAFGVAVHRYEPNLDSPPDEEHYKDTQMGDPHPDSMAYRMKILEKLENSESTPLDW